MVEVSEVNVESGDNRAIVTVVGRSLRSLNCGDADREADAAASSSGFVPGRRTKDVRMRGAFDFVATYVYDRRK